MARRTIEDDSLMRTLDRQHETLVHAYHAEIDTISKRSQNCYDSSRGVSEATFNELLAVLRGMPKDQWKIIRGQFNALMSADGNLREDRSPRTPVSPPQRAEEGFTAPEVGIAAADLESRLCGAEVRLQSLEECNGHSKPLHDLQDLCNKHQAALESRLVQHTEASLKFQSSLTEHQGKRTEEIAGMRTALQGHGEEYAKFQDSLRHASEELASKMEQCWGAVDAQSSLRAVLEKRLSGVEAMRCSFEEKQSSAMRELEDVHEKIKDLHGVHCREKSLHDQRRASMDERLDLTERKIVAQEASQDALRKNVDKTIDDLRAAARVDVASCEARHQRLDERIMDIKLSSADVSGKKTDTVEVVLGKLRELSNKMEWKRADEENKASLLEERLERIEKSQTGADGERARRLLLEEELERKLEERIQQVHKRFSDTSIVFLQSKMHQEFENRDRSSREQWEHEQKFWETNQEAFREMDERRMLNMERELQRLCARDGAASERGDGSSGKALSRTGGGVTIKPPLTMLADTTVLGTCTTPRMPDTMTGTATPRTAILSPRSPRSATVPVYLQQQIPSAPGSNVGSVQVPPFMMTPPVARTDPQPPWTATTGRLGLGPVRYSR